MMKNEFHDLTPLVLRLEKNTVTLRLKHVAESIGYKIKLTSGVLQHDRQVDEFVQVSVCDPSGKYVDTSDGGCLAAYEPVFVHLKTGKIKAVGDWFCEMLNNMSEMIEVLQSGRFLVGGSEIDAGYFNSDFGPVEVERSWKKKGASFSEIRLVNNDDLPSFPIIGNIIIINGLRLTIIALKRDH